MWTYWIATKQKESRPQSLRAEASAGELFFCRAVFVQPVYSVIHTQRRLWLKIKLSHLLQTHYAYGLSLQVYSRTMTLPAERDWGASCHLHQSQGSLWLEAVRM